MMVVVVVVVVADDEDYDRFNRKGDVDDGCDCVTENEDCAFRTKMNTVRQK
jgi:hypothetical protein